MFDSMTAKSHWPRLSLVQQIESCFNLVKSYGDGYAERWNMNRSCFRLHKNFGRHDCPNI